MACDAETRPRSRAAASRMPTLAMAAARSDTGSRVGLDEQEATDVSDEFSIASYEVDL